MPKLSCAILDDYQNVALSYGEWCRLEDRVEMTRFGTHLGDSDLLAAELAAFDIVVAMRERTLFDGDIFARLPKLRLLVTTGMANASIDLEAARAQGVTVCGTRGVAGPAAELAWALLLALVRRIPEESAGLRAADPQWQRGMGRGLQGKTLGVVGLGKLGERVTRYGRAFEMDVIGWSRSNSPARSSRLGISFSPNLDDLLTRADVVSIHVTLNDGTRGLIGRREFGLMKEGAILVNTARGPIVDETALVEALESGRLGGAALDVFTEEPLPADHPIRSLPNVIATPHIGYVTEETYRVFFADVVDDIAAWLDGAPLRVLNA